MPSNTLLGNFGVRTMRTKTLRPRTLRPRTLRPRTLRPRTLRPRTLRPKRTLRANVNYAQGNYDNVISEAKRSDVPYGHASMLLLGEGSEATEPYNKHANLFKE